MTHPEESQSSGAAGGQSPAHVRWAAGLVEQAGPSVHTAGNVGQMTIARGNRAKQMKAFAMMGVERPDESDEHAGVKWTAGAANAKPRNVRAGVWI